jgi:hypothetical protein
MERWYRGDAYKAIDKSEIDSLNQEIKEQWKRIELFEKSLEEKDNKTTLPNK